MISIEKDAVQLHIITFKHTGRFASMASGFFIGSATRRCVAFSVTQPSASVPPSVNSVAVPAHYNLGQWLLTSTSLFNPYADMQASGEPNIFAES